MLATHSRLYDVREQHDYAYDKKRFNNIQESPDAGSLGSMSTVETPHPSTTVALAYPYMENTIPMNMPMLPPYPRQDVNVDFNSCEYLYDSALFGQMVFDSSKVNNSDMNYLPQQEQYSAMLNEANYQPSYPDKNQQVWGN